MDKSWWIALTIIAMVVIPTAAIADAGWRPEHYGPIAATQWSLEDEHPTIAMVSEDVQIVLHKDNVEITAGFDFINTGGNSEAVVMFFPIAYDGGESDSDYSYPSGVTVNDYGYYEVTAADLFTDFSVFIDEKEVKCTFEKKYTDDMHHEASIRALAVWSVDFKPGATRHVICKYTSTYGRASGEIGPYVRYLLFTGATWHGPIGYGRITVRPAEGFDWSVPLCYEQIGIPPAQDKGDSIVWEFKEVEPRTDSSAMGLYSDSISIYYARKAGIRKQEHAPDFKEIGFEGRGGVPARILVDNVNFRMAPDSSADKLCRKAFFKKDDLVMVQERKTDWYRVKDFDGNEGWVRWRYVDPDTGNENRYVELSTVYEE